MIQNGVSECFLFVLRYLRIAKKYGYDLSISTWIKVLINYHQS